MLDKKFGVFALALFLFACSDYKDMYQNAYGAIMDDEEISSSSKTKSSSSSRDGGSEAAMTSSSLTVKVSSSSAKSSSSGAKSSSSGTKKSSSSSAIKSSSSKVFPDGVVGVCAPVATSAELGEKVTWKFTRNDAALSAMDLMNASYVWTFEGGEPASSGKISGAAGVSQYTTYTKSGTHSASLALSVGDKSYVVQCSPVHINGAPITGCKCTTESTMVDFLEKTDVTWSVSGCSTVAGMTMFYAWAGGAAGAETSYTKSFTAATAAVAPTLTVSNDDNSVVDVTCPTVKITEGPEYAIKSPQDKIEFTESGDYIISANLPEGWHNSDRTCNVSCQAQTYNFVVTIDEIELSGKKTGTVYVSKGGLLVAHTVGGYSIPVTVEIPAGESVICGVQW